MTRLFEGARKNLGFVLKFLSFSALFWLAEFSLQYFVLVPGELGISLVRSFAFSGATFIGLALLSSSVFKFKPKYARHWHVRRSLGAMGFVFAALHSFAATNFLFAGKQSEIFFSLNPIENPIVFGLFAYPIFFLMALTSTDWAVEKLGFNRWKSIHRLVYIAYYAAVFHFVTINPTALFNPAGYLLLLVSFLALAGQLYWFVRISAKKKISSLGTKMGIAIILLYLITAYLVFFARQ